jgi:TRAP-type C4-dicarboxylate transport system permease large subunit
VIYAMMANVSVGALFLAGILPGVLMALLMMLTVAYFAHKNNWGGDIKFEWPRVGKALIETGGGRRLAAGRCGRSGAGRRCRRITARSALVVLFAADRVFKFQACCPS